MTVDDGGQKFVDEWALSRLKQGFNSPWERQPGCRPNRPSPIHNRPVDYPVENPRFGRTPDISAPAAAIVVPPTPMGNNSQPALARVLMSMTKRYFTSLFFMRS